MSYLLWWLCVLADWFREQVEVLEYPTLPRPPSSAIVAPLLSLRGKASQLKI